METISANDYQKTIKSKKKAKSKYKNIKTIYKGIKFDSKKEADRYATLLTLEQNRIIKDLVCQPKFAIGFNGVHVCYYKADFAYLRGNVYVVEDVKSVITRKIPTYVIKKKLMLALHDIEIKEV